MTPFSISECPLSGTNLIESSAGTGKTHTISGIFLRLVIEQSFQPEQILVVTFTRAGTEELRERIRSRLVMAADAFAGRRCGDSLVDALVRGLADRRSGLDRVRRALSDFDRAAIFTIHGFCQRLLAEHAFETRSLFDTELKTDSDRLAGEVADDFWRTRFFDLPRELAEYVLALRLDPTDFAGLLRRARSPDIRIVPDPVAPPQPDPAAYRETHSRFTRLWRADHPTAADLLRSPGLSGNIYGGLALKNEGQLSARDLKVRRLETCIDGYIEGAAVFPPPEELLFFTAARIAGAVKKGGCAPEHPLFDAADALRQAADELKRQFDRWLNYQKIAFFAYAAGEMEKRKRRQNIQFFDDLLLSVRNALRTGQGGRVLADAVRQRYRAALVDEFQDTDLVQYEIFSRLFSDGGSLLFMIGDPKQAIYGFRGADVFSYLNASAAAERKYTLAENWRSAPDLITAVNTLFSAVPAPFVFSGIPFEPVAAGPGGPSGALRRLPSGAPMVLWLTEEPERGALGAAETTERVLTATAREIRRLTRAAGTDLGPEDIAVLVRTNRQARQVKQRLAADRIPAVLLSAGSVFDSREARVLEWVLASVAAPGDGGRLKAALATELFGVSAERLEADTDAQGLADYQSRFQDYRRMWLRDGFITMFRRLLEKEKCAVRLLRYPDGERRVTNLFHLSELLQQEAMRNHCGPVELMRWMREQISGGAAGAEEDQLRLESDARSVKIITIHKSKGLEYPVVFCPFTWQGTSDHHAPPIFHDPAAGGRLTIDLGSEALEDHRRMERNETLAEELRLLYVAVTRARQRCYLAWGRTVRGAPGALAYLLHGDATCRPQPSAVIGGEASGDDLAAALKARISALVPATLRADALRLESLSGGTIAVSGLARPDGDGSDDALPTAVAPLSRRHFPGRLETGWQISSYSALVLGSERGARLPETTGEWENDANGGGEAGGIGDLASFPRGTRAGLFFHELFEQLDRRSVNPQQREQLVGRTLEKFGFDGAWQPVVSGMLHTVLSAPMAVGGRTVRLQDVPPEAQAREMEFYFPLKPLTPAVLERVFRLPGSDDLPAALPESLGRLTFSPTRGFMRGFIDLVFCVDERFYLLDWKSNHLGPVPADYRGRRLTEVMAEGHYFLQYHLYTLALHRYLSMRQPGYAYERHFGGVFYVFLRGVDPINAPDAGIFADRPPAQLIEALDSALIDDRRLKAKAATHGWGGLV